MVELTDMDGDGSYDALKIAVPIVSYGARGPSEEYFIKEGYLARSPEPNHTVHLVKSKFFDVYDHLANPSREHVTTSFNRSCEKE